MASVTVTNTDNPSEPKPDEYTIPFKQELINLILTGVKVKTYRYGVKHDYLKIGDLVKVQNSKTKEIVGTALITDKQRVTFKDLPINVPGHEVYENKEQQRQVFSGYYAYIGRKIDDNDPFLVFEFQLKG